MAKIEIPLVVALPDDHPANQAVAESVDKAAAYFAEIEQYHRDCAAAYGDPKRTKDWTVWCAEMAAWSDAVASKKD